MLESLLQRIQRHAALDLPVTLELPDSVLQQSIIELTESTLQGDEESTTEFHHLLACLNKIRIGCSTLYSVPYETMLDTLCTYMETRWLQHESAQIAERLIEIPEETEPFIQWFENFQNTGYGQGHPLFNYLEAEASWDDLRYFFEQELSSEAGFDDLVALTQVKAPPVAKMEFAHNYWDEMGRGNPAGVHGHLLVRLIERFGLQPSETFRHVHWAPLALSNLMIALARHRAWFDQSVGALGVIELTAPGRAAKVAEGLQRIGFSHEEASYYRLHAVIDLKHWAGWRDQVIRPLVTEYPEKMLGIAEGGLLRLLAGERCFDVYTQYLQQAKDIPLQPA